MSRTNFLKKKLGWNFDITDKILGTGTYGKVYLATDENNNSYAVKCCDMEYDGIPNILEASIMSSISHPYLNRSLLIKADNKKLYIIEDLAQSDLSKRTKTKRPITPLTGSSGSPSEQGDPVGNSGKLGSPGNSLRSLQRSPLVKSPFLTPKAPQISSIINNKLLKDWCFALAQAVFCLHKQNIIHADIKASNVLLFKNNKIKLTDYTLAVKKWTPQQKFTHNVCTSTHKPLECFIHDEWDEKLDIWSLGCTFYEIAFGKYLFPVQIDPNKKYKYINAHIYWAKLHNESIFNDVDYFPLAFDKPDAFSGTVGAMDGEPRVTGMDGEPRVTGVSGDTTDTYGDKILFFDLLKKMLKVDKYDRYNIDDVIKHKYFEGLIMAEYKTYKPEIIKLNEDTTAKIINIMREIIPDDIIIMIALYLYQSIIHLFIDRRLKIETTILIAYKIKHRSRVPIFTFPIEKLVETERMVCHELNFRIHHHSGL